MSLNTSQKRGSVINIGQPGRPWIQKPQNQSTLHSRLSMLGFASFPDYAGFTSGLLFVFGRYGTKIGGFKAYYMRQKARIFGSGV
jgi:hypothetical protein